MLLRVCCSRCGAGRVVAGLCWARVRGVPQVWLPRVRFDLPHRAQSAISGTQTLRYRSFCAQSQSRVGDFIRSGNDAIQPLEKSASNSLICNERNFGACGLQIFDARRGERRRGRRERNRALTGLSGQIAKSAGTRRNPRQHAGLRNKKGQPRAVDLQVLVEVCRNEQTSASTP